MRSIPQQHWPELNIAAVHQPGDGRVEIGIGTDIARVLAAKFG